MGLDQPQVGEGAVEYSDVAVRGDDRQRRTFDLYALQAIAFVSRFLEREVEAGDQARGSGSAKDDGAAAQLVSWFASEKAGQSAAKLARGRAEGWPVRAFHDGGRSAQGRPHWSVSKPQFRSIFRERARCFEHEEQCAQEQPKRSR